MTTKDVKVAELLPKNWLQKYLDTFCTEGPAYIFPHLKSFLTEVWKVTISSSDSETEFQEIP